MKRSKFQPGYYTIKDLIRMGFDVCGVEQQNQWVAARCNGHMLDTPNERGEHTAINPVTVKIRMHGAGA